MPNRKRNSSTMMIMATSAHTIVQSMHYFARQINNELRGIACGLYAAVLDLFHRGYSCTHTVSRLPPAPPQSVHIAVPKPLQS
jgi:hypothetical protein